MLFRLLARPQSEGSLLQRQYCSQQSLRAITAVVLSASVQYTAITASSLKTRRSSLEGPLFAGVPPSYQALPSMVCRSRTARLFCDLGNRAEQSSGPNPHHSCEGTLPLEARSAQHPHPLRRLFIPRVDHLPRNMGVPRMWTCDAILCIVTTPVRTDR